MIHMVTYLVIRLRAGQPKPENLNESIRLDEGLPFNGTVRPHSYCLVVVITLALPFFFIMYGMLPLAGKGPADQ